MWTKEMVKFLLDGSNLAVERALLALLERQTVDEQSSEDTKHRNDKGFMQCDAKRMTSMAKQVKRGHRLTGRQLDWLRSGRSTRFPSRIGKYAGQLATMTNERITNCDTQIANWRSRLAANEMADSFEQWGAVNRQCRGEIAKWEAERQRLLPKVLPEKMAEAGKAVA